MPGDIEVQRSAERDVENLQPLADREDRQLSSERIPGRFEFPAIALSVRVFIEHGWIGHFLMKKFRCDIRPTGEKQSVHLVYRDDAPERIPDANLWMRREGAAETFLIRAAHPGSQIQHGRSLRRPLCVVNSCRQIMDSQERTEALREACERAAAAGKTVAIGVAVYDYETDLQFRYHSERMFHAASTIKVAILLSLFKAIDDGRVRADDPLQVRNRFLSGGDGTPFQCDAETDGYPQLYKSIGRTAKVGDLADSMITSSSNLATNLLLDFLSVGYARGVLAAAGIEGVELRRGVDDERAFQQGMNNETSAVGMRDLFGALRGEVLTKPSRDAVIGILLKQRFNSMIPAPLPARASVAHKTGEISTACHDAGIVYLPERQPYIVAILTETSPETDKRRETVAAISKAVSQCLTGELINV